jgi:hypothetical protein
MSYHRLPALGMPAPFTPTTAFAQAVDPYTWRMSRPGAIYAPYGWGPDFNIGMPFNYTHHIGYERVPVPGARRIGPMYDRLPGPAVAGCGSCGMGGSWSGSQPGYSHVAPSGALAGVLAVM